jgi:hypothetical protein
MQSALVTMGGCVHSIRVTGVNPDEKRASTGNQGLTLVHISAQFERFLLDRG